MFHSHNFKHFSNLLLHKMQKCEMNIITSHFDNILSSIHFRWFDIIPITSFFITIKEKPGF